MTEINEPASLADRLEALAERDALKAEVEKFSGMHRTVEAELTANERMVDKLQAALHDSVRTNTENCRQRDALKAENERLKAYGQVLADAAAAAIHGLPEMLEQNALSDEEGMVAQIEMALATWRDIALEPRP